MLDLTKLKIDLTEHVQGKKDSEATKLGFYMKCGGQVNEAELERLEKSGEYVLEAKNDGIWGSAINHSDYGFGFYSRNNNKKDINLPTLPRQTVLVGELGYSSEVASKRKEALGHDFMDIFDAIILEGEYVADLDMEERREKLEKFYHGLNDRLKKHYFLTERVESGFVEFYKKQEEGAVLKRKGKNTPFLPGTEATHWIKVKKVHHVDAVVMGYEVSTSNSHAGLVKAFQLGVYKDGNLVEITSVGSLSAELRRDGIHNWEKYKGRVMEIECYRIFDSGSLRHPSMVRWRDDKPAEDCTWDSLMLVRKAM